MGKIHKAAKKLNPSYYLLDKETFNELHPMGTQAEAAYDASKAAEKALADAEEAPVLALPDEEEIARERRRQNAERRRGGRSSTMLTNSDSLGG